MTATPATGGPLRLGGRLSTALIVGVAVIAIVGVALFIDKGGDGKATVADGGVPKVGTALRDFTVLAPDGSQVQLSSFAGQPLWLSFGGTWCPDCRSEAADVRDAYGRWHPKGLVVLQVFVRDKAADVAAFAKSYGFTFPLGLDPAEDLAAAYGVIGYPTHFFVGRDGKIVSERFGRLTTAEMDQLAQQVVE